MIVRTDSIGRIYIPLGVKEKYGINSKQRLELTETSEGILIKTLPETCTFCGSDKEVKDYLGKKICKNCLDNIK